MKLFVNEPRYDNVAEVLSAMGPGFEFRPAADAFSVPSKEAVLFLNCGGSVHFSDEQLRKFLGAGGTLYLSDLQADLAERLYPDVFKATVWTGSSQEVRARVVDPSLRDIIGSGICLTFDMGGWKYLAVQARAGRTPRIYIEAEGKPLVVSYELPNGGSLFFTAFHNRAQESEKEQDLLRFLLFRPLLSRDIVHSVEEMKRHRLIISREYTGGLWKGAPVKEFVLPAEGIWTARLSWSGQGRLSVELLAPSGQVLDRRSGSTAPLEARANVSANSKVRIRCEEFVHKEIPFCLLTATGSPNATTRDSFVLESHPVSKPEFRILFVASESRLDLLKTSLQIRATLERQSDGTVHLVVHPGGEVRVQPPGTKRWTVQMAGSRFTVAAGMVFFDNQGKTTVRVT